MLPVEIGPVALDLDLNQSGRVDAIGWFLYDSTAFLGLPGHLTTVRPSVLA